MTAISSWTRPQTRAPHRERRSSSGCASPWASSSRSPRIARTGSCAFTISTKAAASAPARPRSSTRARSTASSPAATSTRSTTPSSPSCSAASRRTPTSANGPRPRRLVDVRPRHRGYIKGPTASRRASSPSSSSTTTSTVAVNQGGKRRGSGCAYLEPGTTTSRLPRAAPQTPATSAAAPTT